MRKFYLPAVSLSVRLSRALSSSVDSDEEVRV
jgi:hypothetical protein